MAVPSSEPATLQAMVTSLGRTEANALFVMVALLQQRFEEQIHALANGLTKKGCTKQYDKVLQRVGRLQEKYARATQYYTIEVDKDPDSNLATKLHFERTNVKAKEYAGVACTVCAPTSWTRSQKNYGAHTLC